MQDNVLAFPPQPSPRIGLLITLVINNELKGHMLSLYGADCCGTPVDTYEAVDCYKMWAPQATNVWFGDNHKPGRK